MIRQVRIYVDKEGRKQATIAASEKPEDELCDFCSMKSPPYKVYQCRDFAHPLLPNLWSRGEWNACAPCSELIDKDDYSALLGRCFAVMGLSQEALEAMEILHQEFRKNRITDETMETT